MKQWPQKSIIDKIVFVYDDSLTWARYALKNLPTNYIDKQRRLIFLHVPKAAGSALTKALGVHGFRDHRRPSYMVSARTWEAYTSITCVRHPLDRFLSDYKNACFGPGSKWWKRQYPGDLDGLSVSEYLDRAPYKMTGRPQTDWLIHRFSPKPVDYVLRYEDLQNELPRIQHFLVNPMEQINSSPTLDVEVTDRDLERIVAMYRPDFDMLGYRMDEAAFFRQRSGDSRPQM